MRSETKPPDRFLIGSGVRLGQIRKAIAAIRADFSTL
jgi:hypothetical protein